MILKDKIIVAFDVQDKDSFTRLTNELSGTASYVKVGMELFYRFGHDIIKELKDNNYKVFLDLKMHDIPNTVYNACKVLGENGVDIINVHTSGGSEMMRAAKEGFQSTSQSGLIIAVTQLTSTDKHMLNNELQIPGSVQDSVLNLASLTKSAGLDGVVCSAHEVSIIKETLGSDFKCITPGIRPLSYESDDQKRVMTPLEAIRTGSDYLVIGRPITKTSSPKQAYLDILKEIANE